MSSTDAPTGRLRILEAASELITRRGGADVSMAEIARAAGLSRQAVYLHFADRAALFVALAQYVDERRGLPAALERVAQAPTGVAALREMVRLQARLNPTVWPIARAVDAVRRVDPAAERSWQDRLQHRLEGARRTIARLGQEGVLRPGLDPDVATDLLWTLLSLRTWEDLVLERGWSAARYERYLEEVLLRVLTADEAAPAEAIPARRPGRRTALRS
jgi:AcrR family transcriptional regulator